MVYPTNRGHNSTHIHHLLVALFCHRSVLYTGVFRSNISDELQEKVIVIFIICTVLRPSPAQHTNRFREFLFLYIHITILILLLLLLLRGRYKCRLPRSHFISPLLFSNPYCTHQLPDKSVNMVQSNFKSSTSSSPPLAAHRRSSLLSLTLLRNRFRLASRKKAGYPSHFPLRRRAIFFSIEPPPVPWDTLLYSSSVWEKTLGIGALEHLSNAL